MGNSVSLVCCSAELASGREVMVIKEDGEPLRFKNGIFVKDVLSAYPHHKIIRCCSDRTVISNETQLSCNWLYFLLPVGLTLSEAAYQSLVRSAASQMPDGASRIIVKTENDLIEKGKNGESHGQDQMGKGGSTYNDFSVMYKWKPILKTIPEIASPSV